MVFTISSDVIIDDDDGVWLGFVDAIKKHVSKKSDAANERIKDIGKQIKDMSKNSFNTKVIIGGINSKIDDMAAKQRETDLVL